MIIGLCGPKGSGKSTLANELAQHKFFHRLPFANPIKLMMAELLRVQGVSEEEIFRLVYIDKEEETEFLNNRSSRHGQATLGTEWGRDLMDDLFWLGVWERTLTHLRRPPAKLGDNIVIEDVRFRNEAEMIHFHNGKVGLIQREGFNSSQHISEREYLKIRHDFVIYNDSTPKHMLEQLDKYIGIDK